ncbi:Exporters of the RND superfamily [Methyloversatilis universalis FAM5]|uniref:Exporters of the RND superfamily n=1 Tax=Methyloversatilis universalis (strain ATCC BAA-1314 / DSM 25237 / JCM 13912 / CCUG 52030 / FAM5) TaxID=1000565 RepID=F5R9T7_METUF|nr:MMPL family transporter [Methyloversatilis universalis]EGK72667.1 Exporters of the RND superfamily [Methyloversatilis universalis FAM5]
MKNETFSKVEHIFSALIRHRTWVVMAVAVLTAVMGYLASHVEVKTVFSDLLPKNHPYVAVNQQFKSTFGGSNMVSIMIEVKEGDIFKPSVLAKVQKITVGLQQVDSVDTYQIISIASKKIKEVRASTEGVESRPIMWPELPKGPAEMAVLKEAVLNNPLIYGPYVSMDLKATLITADFLDGDINYSKAFEQIMSLVKEADGDGVMVRVVGEPVLYGWVNYYLDETIQIFFAAIASLVIILLLITRTWHGTVLPLLAGVISAIWALGAAKLMGFHLDPLVIVVAFLITAQAISNSVQLISRYDDEIAHGASSSAAAAVASAKNLFKPSMLAIVADAGCVLVVALTPIPMLEKISYIGTVWIFSIFISALVMTPVMLSFFSGRGGFVHPLNIRPVLEAILRGCAAVVTTRTRYIVLGLAGITFLVSGWYAFNLKVGDANPGSPILWPDSSYNRDATDINRQFQGSDRMFVVVAGKEKGAMREPEVLQSMANFQRYMEAQPEVGGSISLADILPQVRRVLREGNPMYAELGNDAGENSELTYMFVSGSDPGDMDRYADADAKNGAVTLFFRDHQGETIRTAVARVQDYVAQNPMDKADYLLAGGLVGVLAAVNEVILAGQIEAIALALLVLVVCCTVTYRSTVAGVFFMIPVMLSNTITFSYMAWHGIGMNINTLPVVALGIGLGVDYTFYIVDGIREELHHNPNVERAIVKALSSAGRGVLVTAMTLITSVGLWSFSSLRLQADMGLLIALWLFISAFSALFIMPAIVYVFRPAFIVGSKQRPIERAEEPAVVV